MLALKLLQTGVLRTGARTPSRASSHASAVSSTPSTVGKNASLNCFTKELVVRYDCPESVMGTILIVGMAPKMRFSHLSAKRDSSARSTLTGGRLLSRPRRLWRWRTACSRGRSHRSLTQNAPRFSTVLHLSRACLGKLIGFNLMGMAQKGVRSFSAPRFFAKLA